MRIFNVCGFVACLKFNQTRVIRVMRKLRSISINESSSTRYKYNIFLFANLHFRVKKKNMDVSHFLIFCSYYLFFF